MDKKFINHIIVIVGLVIYLLAPGQFFGNVERVYGRAFNKDGKLEYSEEHIIQYENGRIIQGSLRCWVGTGNSAWPHASCRR